jgi:hypothetical protein
MTKISVADGNLLLEVEGWDKLWSLRSHLTIPMKHVIRIYADSTIAEKWWLGLRVAGTHVPGVIAAGTFYQHGNWVFWDVHHPENTVVIDLRDERYEKLIVEVEDAAETVARVQPALPQPVNQDLK